MRVDQLRSGNNDEVVARLNAKFERDRVKGESNEEGQWWAFAVGVL